MGLPRSTNEARASCYMAIRVNPDKFITAIRSIEDFWLTVVKRPPHDRDL